MATLLRTWYTYYLRSGTGTPNSGGDAQGRVDVYLESQNFANNTSLIRIDHKAYFKKPVANMAMAYNVISSYRANQGSYGGTYQTLQTPDPGYVSAVSTSVTEYTRTIGSTYHTVYHNADGTGTLYVQGSIQSDPFVVVGTNYFSTRNSSFSVALPTIPRYANITSYSTTSGGLNSINVYWNADSACDAIEYSLNGGGWTATSGYPTFNIDGLTPNTYYSVKIRVKRTDSQLWTESGILYTTTIANAIITSANVNFNIGNDLPITFTNPSGLQINLRLESPSGTTRLTRTNITSPYTLVLSEAERNVLYGLSPTTNSVAIRITLDTISSSTYYNSKDGTAYIVDANPLFTNFTYEDTNATTIALTGSNQKIIKGYSNLKAIVSVANKAVAQKSATMFNYQLVVGAKQITAPYSAVADVNLLLNAIDSNVFTVYAIDSRNNSTLKQISPSTYIDYFKPYFGTPIPTIERTGGIGTESTLTFAGLFYNANFGSVTNDIELTYEYKKTSDSVYTTGTTTLTPTKVGNNFSFSGIVAGDLGASGFDANFSYNVKITATDSLDTVVYDLLLGSGTPNIAIHQDGVGINQPYDPILGGALQINGNTYVDGLKIPTAKAIGTEIDTGTDDVKYVTSKAILDSKLLYETDIIDNLTSTSIVDPLSAAQGKAIYDLLKVRSQHPIAEYILYKNDGKTIIGNDTWQYLGTIYDLKGNLLYQYPLKTGYTRKYKLKLTKTDNKSSGAVYVRLQTTGGGNATEYLFPITWGSTTIGVKQEALLPVNWDTGVPPVHCDIHITPDFSTDGTIIVYQVSLVIYDELV